MRITRDEYHGRTKITKKEKKEPIKEAPAESPAPLEAPTSAEAPLSSSTNLPQPNKNKVDLSVKLSDAEKIYDKIEHLLMEHYGISHITLQAEVDKCRDKKIFKI